MMRFLRRRPADWRSRHRTVCELYRLYRGECAARAVRLLEDWLSSTQRQQFEAGRFFDVVGCDSGKRYRIHWGRSVNVFEIGETDRLKKGWCFAPVGNLVEANVMLAQKIALETSENKALALANRFSPRFRPS